MHASYPFFRLDSVKRRLLNNHLLANLLLSVYHVASQSVRFSRPNNQQVIQSIEVTLPADLTNSQEVSSSGFRRPLRHCP